MDLIESLFYMLWRGLAIGILVSAPMGPVGIMCIQRTLDKGRKTGFYTGVGAALSDLFYCLLTGFGLSFIEDFVTRNQNVIQLLGSAVLIAFGVYLFRKNPAAQMRRPVDEPVSPKKNILTGFLFTFSNPLILFLIIGLFARFNFAMPGIKWFHYVLGFIAIFFGALGWWWVVTYVIDKVRAHFNLRSMVLINRITGVVIFIFAVVGIVTGISNLASAQGAPVPPAASQPDSRPQALYLNGVRGFKGMKHTDSGALLLDNGTGAVMADSCLAVPLTGDVTLGFRCANLHNAPGRLYGYTDRPGHRRNARHPGWGFGLIGAGDTALAVTVRTVETPTADGSSPGVELRVMQTCGVGRDPVCLASTVIGDGIDPYSGDNIWRFCRTGGRGAILVGNRGLARVVDFDCPTGTLRGFFFAASPGSALRAADITWCGETSLRAPLLPGWRGETHLRTSLAASRHPLAGIWRIYERGLDEKLLRLGGPYVFAIVPDSTAPALCSIVYLAGSAPGSGWRAGMVKGTLRATAFDGIHDVCWTDQEGAQLHHDIKAQLEEPDLLAIQFPYQSSVLRLKKIP